MNQNAKHNPHGVYVINYHLVWIPRYRKKVLVDPVATRLKQLFREISTQYGFEILADEVMSDHVHLFVSAPPKFAPAEVVRLFKGITSRRLRQEFQQIRRAYWGANATLWAEGYYVGPAGHVSAETIRRYSEECQKDSFQAFDTNEHLCYCNGVKLIAQVKLQTTPDQAVALRRTMEEANRACNFISSVAWEKKTFGQYPLHPLVYKDVRKQFNLSAQVVVRCIAKVVDAYKLDKKRKRTFKPRGAITYDGRILSWQMARSQISIWTVNGRIKLPFVCGERQRELLKTRQGESDLVFFRDQFYLSATCHLEEPEPIHGQGVLGIDLGVVNIAVDSDGHTYSGKAINNVRYRHRRLRTKLQKKGTRSAKRLLKKLSGREARFAQDVNHTISKQVVQLAQGTRRDMALEDLKGIRERITARRDQRATLHSWSFYQLRAFLAYKARLAGVNVMLVDPRNTSRTCPVCGCVDKRNRPSQSVFSCVACGFSGFADHVAACNIASRAVVNPPNVARDEGKAVEALVTSTELRQSAATSHPL